MNIGENIRIIRKERKLTLKDLGSKVGLSEQAIGQYERGDRSPNIEVINKIAIVLGVNTNELIYGKNSLSKVVFNECSYLMHVLNINREYICKHADINLSLFNSCFDNGEDLPEEDLIKLIDTIFKDKSLDFLYFFKEYYTLISEYKNLLEFCIKKKNHIEKDKTKIVLSETSFEETKDKVGKNLPTLDPLIELLTNPKIEMVYNYSYNDLAACGYEELLFIAIEKTIRSTLEDIKEHEKNGDIFDGVCSWITKESPVYEILKKSQENNKKVMNELTEKAKNNENK
ncbi:helix-turn-helix transcriptional regulator [Clostridium botulinum]|uniref:helix-turn-helix domain-containing protein n=1 Tax=Clostridium botulinum TaxID=1491 RepID=UPI0022475CD0|nr:helix-turn-helix transcriptional regulator [Clostridium botulinum]UZP03353.1 helix-turn-helix transcriptional regulator [Clostridium botulinum]UZP06711.1 helix-turn-helix transcriptional regulator [Clostridium botulinum]UZP10092.1 helix-turn-helix transcriptional regulator [Clostridium botulinum]